MHNSEPVLDNETHEILWDFEIQTNYLISARRPDLVIVKKEENMMNCGLRRSGESPVKTERKRKVPEPC